MNRSLRNLALLGLFAVGVSSAGAQSNVLFNLQYTPSTRTLEIIPQSGAVYAAQQGPTFRSEYGLLFNSFFVEPPPSSILVEGYRLPTDSVSGGLLSTFATGAPLSSSFPDAVEPRDLNIQSVNPGTMTFGAQPAFTSSTLTITFSSALANSTYMPTSSFSGGVVSGFLMSGTEQSLGTYTYSVVPEPSTYAAIAGALGLAYAVYRRRRQAAAATA
jgi:hypothetical protein